ncbi:glycogen branching enzyme, partial [gut metagenome]
PWLRQHHYNFIEFLPLAEHPFDGSWGYQITGYFSLTSRYGTPDQFASFVNDCHRAGIGVLMDFVPVHFAVNPDALAFLDGGPLYEYDSDVGQSEWGSCNFNLYRGEVRSFLASAAAIWIDVYHCDGLRMDAVSRAIYWQGDSRRGINRGALEFLQNMNQGLHDRWPGIILAAEDST